jgi:hypothetical protein
MLYGCIYIHRDFYSLENEFIPICTAKIVFMLFKPPNSFSRFSHDGADLVQLFRWSDNRVGPISGWPDNWTGTVLVNCLIVMKV